jgi:hypothetical protein
MIPKKYLVELGTYTIRKKGKGSCTLAAPRAWMKYAGASLGDEYLALTDTRDNSLHFHLKKRTSRNPKTGDCA